MRKLILDELTELEETIGFRFNIDLVPRHTREVYAEDALCRKSLIAAYKPYLTVDMRSDLDELKNITACDKIDPIKISAVTNHNFYDLL